MYTALLATVFKWRHHHYYYIIIKGTFIWDLVIHTISEDMFDLGVWVRTSTATSVWWIYLYIYILPGQGHGLCRM